MDIKKIESQLDNLFWLPAGHATSLASFPDMKRVIDVVTIIGGAPFPLPKDAHGAAERGKIQLDIMHARVTEFIDEYMPILAT